MIITFVIGKCWAIYHHHPSQSTASRSIRVEHLLIDSQNNIKLISWTRAVFARNASNGHVMLRRREFRSNRKNHMPPECFIGQEYNPVSVDAWSLGVLLVALFTCRHPFNLRLICTLSLPQQWKHFTTKYGQILDACYIDTLNRLFLDQVSARCGVTDLMRIINQNFDKLHLSRKAKSKQDWKAPDTSSHNKYLDKHDFVVNVTKNSTSSSTQDDGSESAGMGFKDNKSKKNTEVLVQKTAANVPPPALELKTVKPAPSTFPMIPSNLSNDKATKSPKLAIKTALPPPQSSPPKQRPAKEQKIVSPTSTWIKMKCNIAHFKSDCLALPSKSSLSDACVSSTCDECVAKPFSSESQSQSVEPPIHILVKPKPENDFTELKYKNHPVIKSPPGKNLDSALPKERTLLP